LIDCAEPGNLSLKAQAFLKKEQVQFPVRKQRFRLSKDQELPWLNYNFYRPNYCPSCEKIQRKTNPQVLKTIYLSS